MSSLPMYSAALLIVFSSAFCAQAASGGNGGINSSASYTAQLAGGKFIVLKGKGLALYSLLGLSSTAGKDVTGSALIELSCMNGTNLVILTTNANAFTYNVSTNKKTGAAMAKGKGDNKMTFTATSDNSKSFLSMKFDITAVASQLPQTTKGKPKATFIGVTQFTLTIGSASFVGTVDSKGRISYP